MLLVLGNRIAKTGTPLQNMGATTVSEEMKVVKIIDDAYENTLYADYPDEKVYDTWDLDVFLKNGYRWKRGILLNVR